MQAGLFKRGNIKVFQETFIRLIFNDLIYIQYIVSFLIHLG